MTLYDDFRHMGSLEAQAYDENRHMASPRVKIPTRVWSPFQVKVLKY